MAERLQKILANTGLGSRRELETWITDGLIKVNGQTAKLGDKADVNDNLTVKGRFYRVVDKTQDARKVLMYHKPLGEVTSRSDPENRKTVFDRLPPLQTGRWVSVGRLDINTLGLLLLTDDGQLANALMHPSSNLEREYAARINGRVSPEIIQILSAGVELEDGLAKFNRIKHDGGEGSNQWFRVIVNEGRNRVVRRLWESQNLQVSRLIRVRYGPVLLPKWLQRGKYEWLDSDATANLMKAVGMDARKATSNLHAVPVHPRHKRRAARRR